MLPKYKPNDYIIVTGECTPNLIGKTVRIHNVYDDCYMVDLMMDSVIEHKIWKIEICDKNSQLNEAMCVLYGS